MSDMVMKMTEEQRRELILDLAKQQHPLDTCEIDTDAEINESADNGAYVQAWVWVSFAGTELDKEDK